jgi:hypothetical protein
MSSIDARRYDAWVTREPWFDDHEPWQELLHCKFCGAWVSTKKENLIANVTHTVMQTCYGTESGYDNHDECPKSKMVDGKWVTEAHGQHEIVCYAGQTTYYRCQRCGGEAELSEF